MKQLGGMEVLETLSRGGMGEVYLARKSGPYDFSKLIAIKTIRIDLKGKEAIREMFLDEARLAARLDHPTIAQVHDFGEEADLLYLAMEYIAGVSFRRLATVPPIPPTIAAQLIAETCRGLDAAHNLTDLEGRPLQVVHRDISPQNLMLTFDGRVKILDFGIALARDRRAPVTEVGLIKGKLSYIAPEQADNRIVDRRTDIYSAGIVLYELLTGSKLFPPNLFDLSQRTAPPPSEVESAIPKEVDDIVLRALQHDPDHRYGTAGEMAAALEGFAEESGGVRLPEFAQRFERERTEHRTHLMAVLEGSQSGSPLGRTTPTLADSPTVTETVTAGAKPDETRPDRRQAETRVPWRRIAIVVFVVLLGIGTGAVLFWTARTKAPRTKVMRPLPVVQRVSEDGGALDAEAIRAPDASTRRLARKRPRRMKRKQAVVDGGSKPAEPVRFGSITIGAEPYAHVVIDGENVGVTPMINRRIEVGPHEIRLLKADTRALLQKRTVVIKPEELLYFTPE